MINRFSSVCTTLRVLVTAILVVQLLGCGTILYPERRGQAAGRYDTDIVILDAIGLLFFIVPGVVAFGVDFRPVPSTSPRAGKANRARFSARRKSTSSSSGLGTQPGSRLLSKSRLDWLSISTRARSQF